MHSNRSERRRHKVFVTRNTEYHFRDRLCVAVRDRRTGDFLPGHLALKRELAGGVAHAVVPSEGHMLEPWWQRWSQAVVRHPTWQD